MENNHTIIVDTLGSDKGPLEIIEGAKLLLENFSDLHIVLVGDEEFIKQEYLPKLQLLTTCLKEGVFPK